MRHFTLPLALSLGALAVLPPAAAQQHPNVAQGFNPSASFAVGDVDNVNLFNGNLVIRIPLGQSYPVNAGLSYGLTLVYNSQVWEHQVYNGTAQSLPFRTSNAGLGWTVSLGRLNPPYTPGEFETARETWMSPDGARHTLYPTLHEGETANANILYTRDGTYLRYDKAAGKLEFPDGSFQTFDVDGQLTRIEDRFGNFVNICYNCCPQGPCTKLDDPWPWKITDLHNRTHWVYFKYTGLPYQPLVVDRVEMDSFGSQPAADYVFHYDIDEPGAVPVEMKGCGNADPATNNVAVALLTGLELPDDSAWAMPAYFNTPTGLCKTGMIQQLVLPTLGSIEWDYTTYRYPTQSTNRSFWQNTTGVAKRTLRDALGNPTGDWTYRTTLGDQVSPGVYAELINSVTDPLGHAATRYFSVCAGPCGSSGQITDYGLPFTRQRAGDGAGRFLSSQIFHQNGANLRSTYLRYERDADITTFTPDLQDWTRLNQRQASSRTVYHDDGGTVADETFSDFDGYGNYRSRSTDGNFPGSNLRTAAIGYNPGRGTYGTGGFSAWPTSSPWILSTYAFSWELENGQLQYRSYCFNASGFLTGRRVHAVGNASYAANDLVEVFTGDTRGNVASEKYFGGDTQAMPTDPTAGFICTLTDSLTNPVYKIDNAWSFGSKASTSYTVGTNTLLVLDQTIDRSTGLPGASRDTAGRQTNYSYDARGRITQVEPPQGAVTTVTYRNATSASILAQVKVSNDLSGTNYGASRTTFDAFGRPALEEEQMPTGTWVGRTITYNALGWKTAVTEREVAFNTQFLHYDPFGRPGAIRPPDGGAQGQRDVTLSYLGTRQVKRSAKVATGATSETLATTTEVYDRFGRLYEVTEPNGVVTRYEYDTGNHLRRVCQGVNVQSGACGQERLFTYDNRGLLLWENHPEKTANTYGQGHDVDYINYDARGHATRKVDRVFDLTFLFDKYERLTQVRETGAGNCQTNGTSPRCLKAFTYATANGTATGGGTDWKKGKLTSASRYNYVATPFNAVVEVKESYQYGGRGGRMSQQDTANIFNGTQNEVFRQTYTWNETGDLSSHTYPDCTTTSLCGAASPRTQSYGSTRGRLTSVAGFATALTYHPSGMVATVVRTNGITDHQLADPTGQARPLEIKSLRTSDSFRYWTTGLYDFDPSGNIKKTGNALYLYDTLSRIVSGTVYSSPESGGTSSTQTYVYDNYGNLTGTTTDGVLVSSPASATTNRLTAGTYDAAGNLTAWSGNTYEHDAFGQMTRLVSSGEDWRYVYTAGDERFWSYKTGGGGSIWTLRGPGGQVLREYTSHLGWTHYRDTIYRGGTLLASVASAAAGGAVSHLHTDHLGTPRYISDATGNPANTQYHAYYPYGQELAATYTTAYANRLRFTGHERDLVNPGGQGDDLDYMHARHYSVPLGRFLSVDRFDVLALESGDAAARDQFRAYLIQPQNWNRYSYTKANPLKYVDPDGDNAVLVLSAPLAVEGGGAAGFIAVANPVGAVVLAGAGGALIGTALNEIPGVSEAIQGGFGLILDSIFLAQNTKQVAKVVAGNVAQAEAHLAKIGAAGGPGKDPHFDHHQKEIRSFLENARKAAEKLPGKLKTAALKKIAELAQKAGVPL